MQNPIVKYGLYYSLAAILITLAFYLIDPTILFGGWTSFLLSLVIMIIFAVLVNREIKERSDDGLLSYGSAFKNSFLVILIGGIISTLFTYILINFIDPSLLDIMKDSTIATTRSSMEMFGANEDAIDQAIATIEEQEMTYGISKVLMGSVIIAIFAAILSLITSIFTKRID